MHTYLKVNVFLVKNEGSLQRWDDREALYLGTSLGRYPSPLLSQGCGDLDVRVIVTGKLNLKGKGAEGQLSWTAASVEQLQI